ncbi:prephenate dehydrogenase [Palleronia caenipelagi]|uniref:Prephenate dehydrogenase/arogenate dehydrogenase family protein n=1 Tax=Palleronia caenipelagi TaxID=2489174 RepID=A0A547Q5I2_9RHOB|nr:prephenate dehydrogenase/arogenate dehydrogenase family protein [Palleronia caenipelagi]TRD21642.1 prephenate dehydrogenase/arogenate dehydrogenase family protein [Palleronia caenipelagi]
MDQPTHIGIVGTGLIGAALAELIAERHPEITVHAVEPNGAYRAAVSARLPRIKWAHCATELATCDLICLACPPDAVTGLAREIAAAGNPLMFDVASVKERITTELSDVPRFVGGHPLSGGNSPGPFEAEPDALIRTRFVITPHPGNSDDDIETVEHFLASLGMTVFRMDPKSHDALLARTSHLPHLLSYGYAQMLDGIDAGDLVSLASRSTREMTHFASDNTAMWAGIFQQNAPHVSAALDDVILDLMRLRESFAKGDTTDLMDRLGRASARAASLSRSSDE